MIFIIELLTSTYITVLYQSMVLKYIQTVSNSFILFPFHKISSMCSFPVNIPMSLWRKFLQYFISTLIHDNNHVFLFRLPIVFAQFFNILYLLNYYLFFMPGHNRIPFKFISVSTLSYQILSEKKLSPKDFNILSL